MATDSKSEEDDDSLRLLFLHGLPGVGKLTTSKILVETQEYLPNYKLLHNHLIIDPITTLFTFASPPFVKLRELHWLQLFEEAFKYKKEQKSKYKCDGIIFTFAFEFSVTDKFLPNLMDLINKYSNVKITFIELKCNQDTLLKRAVSKDREKYSKLTDINMIKEFINNGNIYSGHKYITETLKKENIQINSEGKSPQEIAKKISQKISEL